MYREETVLDKRGVPLLDKGGHKVKKRIYFNANEVRQQFNELVGQGVIQGGMIPKLENAFQAIDAGVKEVIITAANAIDGHQGTKIR